MKTLQIMDTLFIYTFYLLIGLCMTRDCLDNERCVLTESCPYALKLIRDNDLKTLQHMSCGFEGNRQKVCCLQLENDNNTIIFYDPPEETATPRLKPTTTMKPEEVQTLPSEIPSDPFPDRNVCGRFDVSNRIHSGAITDLKEFPWLARLSYLHKKRNGEQVYHCGASLITDRYVITAAHCVVSGQYKELTVRLGEWDTETETDCIKNICTSKTVDVNVSKIIPYPTYSSKPTVMDDIALLQLQEPVTFSNFVQPVCLPTTDYVASQDYVDNTSYWSAGWGVTEFGEVSVIKRKVMLEAVPVKNCKDAYNIEESLLPNLICAGGYEGRDTCKGDSGGPLVRTVIEDSTESWFLYGITSFGNSNCGEGGVPGVYTRIKPYMNWIRDVLITA